MIEGELKRGDRLVWVHGDPSDRRRFMVKAIEGDVLYVVNERDGDWHPTPLMRMREGCVREEDDHGLHPRRLTDRMDSEGMARLLFRLLWHLPPDMELVTYLDGEGPRTVADMIIMAAEGKPLARCYLEDILSISRDLLLRKAKKEKEKQNRTGQSAEGAAPSGPSTTPGA